MSKRCFCIVSLNICCQVCSMRDCRQDTAWCNCVISTHSRSLCADVMSPGPKTTIWSQMSEKMLASDPKGMAIAGLLVSDSMVRIRVGVARRFKALLLAFDSEAICNARVRKLLLCNDCVDQFRDLHGGRGRVATRLEKCRRPG